ncbi:hypothetical protein [Staphylothermus hellenicus]|uniref:Uncharacterized protein n=1 Tax=Staphylothermus hellenicus (strain DSM 12710 / JCM 10830 / BK20S6-10-b1 / P8) TaxID=591019 RepID=D7D9G0_STAHD|nr:hypothetical protein Shell_1313 [Staphylothermus hellenicus DSM 12710]
MGNMRLLRKPPRIKVLEAIGSIGDQRVKVLDDHRAEVVSSRGDRVYKVIVEPVKHNVYHAYSSDNGTIFRGYVGYPIIAFLMTKSVIPIDKEVMKAVTGVPWKDLNERYKKYSIVENIVLNRAERMGVSREIIMDYINIVMKKLGLLKIYFVEELKNKF